MNSRLLRRIMTARYGQQGCVDCFNPTLTLHDIRNFQVEVKEERNNMGRSARVRTNRPSPFETSAIFTFPGWPWLHDHHLRAIASLINSPSFSLFFLAPFPKPMSLSVFAFPGPSGRLQYLGLFQGSFTPRRPSSCLSRRLLSQTAWAPCLILAPRYWARREEQERCEPLCWVLVSFGDSLSRSRPLERVQGDTVRTQSTVISPDCLPDN